VQILGLTPTATTVTRQLNATFAGVPVVATVEITVSGVNCSRTSLTAVNVNVTTAIPNLWAQAPAVVRTALAGVRFPRLSSTVVSGGRAHCVLIVTFPFWVAVCSSRLPFVLLPDLCYVSQWLA
jgi:hypothetical protein